MVQADACTRYYVQVSSTVIWQCVLVIFNCYKSAYKSCFQSTCCCEQTVYNKEAELDLMEQTMQVVVGMWKSR